MAKIRKNSKEFKTLVNNQDNLSNAELFRARIEKLRDMFMKRKKK